MRRWKLLVLVCLLAGVGAYGASLVGPSSQAARAASPRPIRWIAVRDLAHGTLPGRQTFTIRGERYRFHGRVYLTLAISIDRPGTPPGGGGGASFNPSQIPGALAYTALVACSPRPYAVVFGLLRAPSDVVVVRHGKATTVLTHAPIPPALKAQGVLAYERLGGPPSELILRRPDGRRLRDDKLQAGRCSPGLEIVLPSVH